ncbi:MAG: hypothetical protein QOD04_2472 [Pseudonocardiales bacterium]|nr:hypothetical protein [Pseudonocardiales bacterium]
MTATFLNAILVVAALFTGVAGALALTVRSHLRRRLDDARAEARHWVERLGGELLVLDSAAAARPGDIGPAGLAEAAERFTAAGAELGTARTPRQCRLAQQSAVEGLHHVRTARKELRLDAGPRVPRQGVARALHTVLTDAGSLPRLVHTVLDQARGRAQQLPSGQPTQPVGLGGRDTTRHPVWGQRARPSPE